MPFEVVPDFDRDGVIDDTDRGKVSEDDPWRWWINDDNDEDVVGGDDIPSGSGNGLDVEVNGLRDLVDWFPLWLDIKQVLQVLPSSTYDYVFENEDNAFNLVETTLTKDSAGDFLRGEMGSVSERNNPNGLHWQDFDGGHFKFVQGQNAKLTTEFLDSIENETGGVLLMEAGNATTTLLRLVVRKKDGGDQVAEMLFPVSITSVEDMFRHVNLAASAGGSVSEANRTGEPTNYPDDLTRNKNFVFVHGYDVPQDAAQGCHAEAFKRLHQLGSRAKFVGVTWHGDTGVDYHQAVKHAFLTGEDLGSSLSSLGLPGQTVVAAHSLGNMVASSAIQDTSFSPDYYFMINAAVPIEAYDDAQQSGEGGVTMEPRMTEDSWKPYRGVADKALAYNWHQLFTDARSQITWKGRFADMVDVAYNFYSTGEDVVENASANESVSDNIWNAIWTAVSTGNKGRHAWVAQEIAKGSTSALPNWSHMLGDGMHGGWGYNRDYNAGNAHNWQKYSPTQAAGISDAQLRLNPFFRKFEDSDRGGGDFATYDGSKLRAVDGDSAANAEASKATTRYKLLGEAIPASSFAAAANSVQVIPAARNHNMMDLKNGNDWPSNVGSRGDDWFHSDFRVLSFNYVWPMWQEMINTASLDQ